MSLAALAIACVALQSAPSRPAPQEETRPASRPGSQPATLPATLAPELVFVLAGQSNMEGDAYLEGREVPSNAVLQFGPTTLLWKPAAEPLHGPKPVPDIPGWGQGPPWSPRPVPLVRGFGPGVAFGKEMARRASKTIGLVPVASSGSSMVQWDPALILEPTSLYGHMVQTTQTSGGHATGLLWYQGESDALGDGPTVLAYEQRFTAFIASSRKDLGAPDAPFVFAQIARFVDANPVNAQSWNFIQETQRKITQSVPRSAMVSTIDLMLDDPVHLGTEGERRLGIRFAKVMARMMGVSGSPDVGPSLGKIEYEGAKHDRIRVTYAHVNVGLRPSGRVLGFSVAASDGTPAATVFDASVDPRRRNTVVVRLAGAAPFGATLSYGRGLDPACNLTDEEDLAAPVFGPLSIE